MADIKIFWPTKYFKRSYEMLHSTTKLKVKNVISYMF